MIELDLENYKRYVSPTSVKFLPGLTVISGENGAGKTSLTEAILHALFGPAKGHTSQADGTTQTYKLGLRLESRGVKLDVQVCGPQHQVHLEGQSQVTFGSNSMRAAAQAIEHYLGGLKRQQFARVYFALQGETNTLAVLPHGQRKTLIQEVLQLDTVKEAVGLQKAAVDERVSDVQAAVGATVYLAVQCGVGEGLDELYTGVRKTTNDNTRHQALGFYLNAFTQARERYAERLGGLQQEREVAEQAVVGAVHTAQECSARHQQLAGQDRAFHDRQKAFADADRAVSVKRAEEEEIRRGVQREADALSNAQAAEPGARLHGQAVADGVQLNTELLTYLAQRTAVARLRDVEQEIDQQKAKLLEFAYLGEERADQQAELRLATELSEQYHADPYPARTALLDQVREQLESQATEHREVLEALSAEGLQVCKICGNPLTPQQQQRRRVQLDGWLSTEYASGLLRFTDQQNELQTEHRRWQTAKREAADRLGSAQKKDAAGLAREQQRETLQQLQEVAQQTRETRARECTEQQIVLPFDPDREPVLRSRLAEAEAGARRHHPASLKFAQLGTLEEQLKKGKERLQVALEEVGRLEAVRSAIDYDAVAHTEVQAQLGVVAQEKEEVDERVRAAQSEFNRINEQVNLAQGRAFELQASFSKLEETISALRREEQLFRYLDGFQSHFFDVNSREVMRRATALIQKATAGAIYTLELDGEGRLFYRDQAFERQAAARLSGGELALVGLCIRLALAEQAQTVATSGRVKFLILDEVLGSLDDERRRQVQKIFDTVLAAGTFECIVMITHLDEVKNNWAAHRLEVLKDLVNNTSTVSRLTPTVP